MKNGAKLNKTELIDLISYGLKENNIDIDDINRSKIESIIVKYIKLCNNLQEEYILDELDTFKRAACLLVAINRGKLSDDKKLNAAIALDAAYKMCEKPYWYIGNIPQELEKVEFKKAFENDMYAYEKPNELLINSLVYENVSPRSYSLSLEMVYQTALQLKHDPIQLLNREGQEKSFNSQLGENPKRKRKFLNLFRKNY